MYCSFLLTLLALPAMAGPPGLTGRIEARTHIEYIELEALNVPALLAEDIENEARGKPPRYAVVKDIAPVTPRNAGTWSLTEDGKQVWSYRVNARDATSVELGFERFHLPEGAALYVYGNNGKRVRGPFTAHNNEAHGKLWVPIIEGDQATIELVLEPGVPRAEVDLKLTQIAQGYWKFWKAGPVHAGACNVDVACPAANGWQDEIQSVARISIGGGLCSGQMLANTDGTSRPLFLTANHCGIRESNAANVTVYWNFENQGCRAPGSAASGGDGNDLLDNAQSGAMFLARYASSDFTLIELDDLPEASYNVFWTGWDRRNRIFFGGTGIHHPRGEEKRISFEEDSLIIIDGAEVTIPGFSVFAIPRSHLQVTDWDLGTTEPASSGSGLWNPQHRLVGQLHGGGAACGNNEPDWYGRLAVSWAGGGTPNSALRPWLDPAGTGEKFIDGYYACGLSKAFEIDITPAAPRAGDLVTLRAVAPNGESLSDFTFRWDVDGDGQFDGEGAVIETRYAEALEAQVSVEVREKSGQCDSVFNKTVSVEAPAIAFEAIGNREQINGDGDDDVEPGEVWRLPVTLKNSGDARAEAVIAVFTRAGVTENAQSTGGPDEFGYTFSDSGTVSCSYQFEDISQAANQVSFTRDNTPNNNVPARDDGGTEPITLDDFEFYGRNVNAVVMSSNGYLTTSAARHGGDYDNDCPLPAAPAPNDDPGGARLAVFHDDLITGDAYSAHFNNCPRPADSSDATGACHIFQWNDVGLIRNSRPFDELDVPHFDFQAILYEGSNEVVYQFGPATPQTDGSPTVGIQNDPATVGLTYACQSAFNTVEPGHPKAQSAVCFFHPDSVRNEASSAFTLRASSILFGDIAPNQSKTVDLFFAVRDDADCGSVMGIQLHGAQFEGGFSAGPGTIYKTRLGGSNAVCDSPIASKTTPALQHVLFTPGLWYNPDRSGHGADVSLANDGSTGVITWYTYDETRSPVWYQAVGPYRNNQIHADLYRFTWDGDEATPEDVGEAIFTVQGSPPIGSKASSALFNWTLNGEKGGEPFQAFIFAPGEPPTNHSGLWFPRTQSGWGVTFNNEGSLETGVLFFYDAAGQPIWALGVKQNPSGDTVPLEQYSGTCPGCPWVKQTAVDAGSVTRSFSGSRKGTLSTDVDIQPPREGQWNKGPVPIEILTDPRP